jgi:hypothetical protein
MDSGDIVLLHNKYGQEEIWEKQIDCQFDIFSKTGYIIQHSAAGSSGDAFRGVGLYQLDAETMGLNPA